jgi:hypothetical protein
MVRIGLLDFCWLTLMVRATRPIGIGKVGRCVFADDRLAHKTLAKSGVQFSRSWECHVDRTGCLTR